MLRNHKLLTQPVLHSRQGQKVVESSFVQRSSTSNHPVFFIKNESERQSLMRTLHCFDFCHRIFVKCIVLLTSLRYIRLRARARFETISLKSSESTRLLFCQRHNLCSRAKMVYSQFVGMSENRNLRILRLEVTQVLGIECFKNYWSNRGLETSVISEVNQQRAD